MFKRIGRLSLAVILLLVVSAPATAQQVDYAALSAEDLAYCNLSATPEEWKDDVLEARRDIIFSTS